MAEEGWTDASAGGGWVRSSGGRIRPWDPFMLTLSTVLLGVAAFLATVIPARRAASVEPMVALRSE